MSVWFWYWLVVCLVLGAGVSAVASDTLNVAHGKVVAFCWFIFYWLSIAAAVRVGWHLGF